MLKVNVDVLLNSNVTFLQATKKKACPTFLPFTTQQENGERIDLIALFQVKERKKMKCIQEILSCHTCT